MSYSFEHIPRLIWGCGDGRYGDKNAKQKALSHIKKDTSIFIPDSIIWDYEKHYNHQILNPNRNQETLPYLWQFGSVAHAIPSEIAITILKDFKPGFFDGFMLRDLSLCNEDNSKGMHTQNITNEHLLLDFNGLVYSIGYRTDHCYD